MNKGEKYTMGLLEQIQTYEDEKAEICRGIDFSFLQQPQKQARQQGQSSNEFVRELYVMRNVKLYGSCDDPRRKVA